MALIVDQELTFKHFCKVCKKGFVCGRALGGHMRTHGIGDEIRLIDDNDDLAGEWDEKNHDKIVRPINRRPMYGLRTNPNRLKSCRICENCGQEFLSWKSFLEHGKCNSVDAESLVSSPDSDGVDSRQGNGWYKRKRTLRLKVDNFSPTCPSSEEEDLANCLMMLSNANTWDRYLAEQEESCASASKEDDRKNTTNSRRNMMNYHSPSKIPQQTDKPKSISSKGIFECKACKKVFNSHQALGGHRASHKKVKGCFAAKLDQTEDSLENDDVITQEDHQFKFSTKSSSSLQLFNGGNISSNPPLMTSTLKKRTKIHECSICHRIFSTGQALGGHKRCHWITSSATENSTLAKIHHLEHQMELINNNNNATDSLDLNYPAPADERVSTPANIRVSTSIFLQSWIKEKEKKEEEDDRQYYHRHLYQINENDQYKNNDGDAMIQRVDIEADSEMKLAKLGGHADKNITGGSSPWLQMGIGLTTDVGADP